MLPGITPFMADAAPGTPPLAASMSPNPATWGGFPGAYTTGITATVTSGVSPYTYAWSVDAGSISSGQGTPNVTLSSTDGPFVNVSCAITDSVSQMLTIFGTVSSI